MSWLIREAVGIHHELRLSNVQYYTDCAWDSLKSLFFEGCLTELKILGNASSYNNSFIALSVITVLMSILS